MLSHRSNDVHEEAIRSALAAVAKIHGTLDETKIAALAAFIAQVGGLDQARSAIDRLAQVKSRATIDEPTAAGADEAA